MLFLIQSKLIILLQILKINFRIRENSKKLKNKLASYPFSAKEKFISWVEYVAKFKDFSEFDLHAIKMNFIQLYNLDVYLTISFFILIFVICAIIIFKKIVFIFTNFIKNRKLPKNKNI